MFEIPHYAADVYSKREELRVLRENVLLVVRDYNRIIAVLSPEERALFKERIRFLDRKIHPGLTKLSWASKGVSEFYVNDCRVNSGKVQQIVDEYKHANISIMNSCRSISEEMLVKIDSKKVFDDLEFDEDHRSHAAFIQARLEKNHSDIVDTMRKIYEVFKNDSTEVKLLKKWHTIWYWYLSIFLFACIIT